MLIADGGTKRSRLFGEQSGSMQQELENYWCLLGKYILGYKP